MSSNPPSTTDNPDDRFGFSDAVISAVTGEHNSAGVLRTGCYVPTRKEVATMEPPALIGLLSDWFWESPSELIPSDAQEEAVISILKARPDATAFGSFIRDAKRPIKSGQKHKNEPRV